MKLPDAPWQRRIDRLLATLGGAEGATRYVGGCVRDTLLGLPVSDVDPATRGTRLGAQPLGGKRVAEHEVEGGAVRPAALAASRGVHAGGVPEVGRAPRLVVGDPRRFDM